MLYWSLLGTLVAACCLLAVLQYRWTGELSLAEHERLRTSLQTSLQKLSREVDSELASECMALRPSKQETDELGGVAAYSERYAQWKASTKHPELFSRVAIAIPTASGITLQMADPHTNSFVESAWPEEWGVLRARMIERLAGGPPPGGFEDSLLVEFPRFGGPGQRERDWLILQLNLKYLTESLMPELLRRYLTFAFALDAEIRTIRGEIVLRWPKADRGSIAGEPDARVRFLELRSGPGGFGGPGPGGSSGRGRWELLVRSREGSLDALVAKTRWRNLAVSGAILLLLISTVGVLLRLSRQAEQLAEAQLRFVAGVSHELRTPLTVIRTAAHNLRTRLSGNPAQVEKYGRLIQGESEKLTAMIDRVLHFAGAQAGHVIRKVQPVPIEGIISAAVQPAAGKANVETRIAPGLPLLQADPMALTQAIQNLVENAVKHGSDWVSVSATQADGRVEIRVADRGPGIPASEQARIFDAFFRGKRALSEQVHGTGLGLNLVKRIVEAHGGSVTLVQGRKTGTEFLVRIPAASPSEMTNETAHSTG